MSTEEVHVIIDAFQDESEQELRSFCCGLAEEGNDEAAQSVHDRAQPQ